jgi:hypothetical protein
MRFTGSDLPNSLWWLWLRGREPKLLLHALDKLLSAYCNCLHDRELRLPYIQTLCL